MESMHLFLISFLVIGFAAGAGAVWLLLQGRMNTAYDRAKTETESERAELNERVRGKEEHIQGLRAALDQNTTAFGDLRKEVGEITEKRTAAESEKAVLAERLQERAGRVAALEAAIADLQVEQKPAADSPPAQPIPLDRQVLESVAQPIEEKLAQLRARLDEIEDARNRSAASSQALRDLVSTVFERLGTLSHDVAALRNSLARSLDLCNLVAGSLETGVLAPARQLKALGSPEPAPPAPAPAASDNHRDELEENPVPFLAPCS